MIRNHTFGCPNSLPIKLRYAEPLTEKVINLIIWNNRKFNHYKKYTTNFTKVTWIDNIIYFVAVKYSAYWEIGTFIKSNQIHERKKQSISSEKTRGK